MFSEHTTSYVRENGKVGGGAVERRRSGDPGSVITTK